jgi:phosphate/sulfate permease
MAKLTIKHFKKEVATLMIGAFGFVSALFWRDAISELISSYVPEGSTWPYMMLSALIVTVISIVAVFFISKYLNPKEK